MKKKKSKRQQNQSSLELDYEPEKLLEGVALPQKILKELDFKLGCHICVDRKSNFKLTQISIDHQCRQDYLLAERIKSKELLWIRCRPDLDNNGYRKDKNRDDKSQYTKDYKMCIQFAREEPCKLREKDCSFCHSSEEMDLWYRDRQEELSITAIVETLQKMPKIVIPVIEDKVPPRYPNDKPRSDNKGDEELAINPIPDKYDLCLACHSCISGSTEKRKYRINEADHTCAENLLFARGKGEKFWTKLRHRKQHRPFMGRYALCRNFCADPPKPCSIDAEICCFAHSHEEQVYWDLEKSGKFNISAYTSVNRKGKELNDMTGDIKASYPGTYIRICEVCFENRPSQVSYCYNNNLCSAGHDWCGLLVLRTEGKVIPIYPVPTSISKSSIFVCESLHYCTQRHEGKCLKPHSLVERDIWIAELSGGLASRDGLVHVMPVTSCPIQLEVVCGLCWKNGQTVKVRASGTRCDSKNSHPFEDNKIYIDMTNRRFEIRNPQSKPARGYVMCKQIKQGKQCQYIGKCAFAHNPSEEKLWAWMSLNQIENLSDLVAKNLFGTGSCAKPKKSQADGFYCMTCGICVNTADLYESHFNSQKHLENVSSDREHQWNFRAPTWNFNSSQLKLCQMQLLGGNCEYSKCTDEENHCSNAHSQDELDEWRHRLEFRSMKKKISQLELSFSYMKDLLKDLDSATHPSCVMTEKLQDVTLTCDSCLDMYNSSKEFYHSWWFTLQTKNDLKLEKVALLYDNGRLHFSLSIEDEVRQWAHGQVFKNSDGSYTIGICFRGGLWGSFCQTVVFDFGSPPVMYRRLTVELAANAVDLQRLERLRRCLPSTHWTQSEQPIHGKPSMSPYLQQLHQKYPVNHSQEVVTQNAVNTGLNVNNYVQKMHHLVALEELTQLQMLTNLHTNVVGSPQKFISELNSPYIHARGKELFVRVELDRFLNDETETGRLLVESVTSAYVAAAKSPDNIWFCECVSNSNFGLDGKGENYIYICLSEECVTNLNMQPDNQIDINVQFGIDRQPFLEKHDALDRLKDLSILFPTIAKMKQTVNTKSSLNLTSKVLNDSQVAIVKHVLRPTFHQLPPYVVYGPFGTGKTEALSQAAMMLLSNQPQSRLLIATHVNAAADLYILKHLREFSKKNKVKVLRVYTPVRRIETVPLKVKEFCLIDEANRCFRCPSREEINEAQIVVVTLATVNELLEISPKFSHVFIDEAGQALESECLSTLTFINPTTCVVLAGDHLQMSPPVYSVIARQQNYHQTLLQRLLKHYKQFLKSNSSSDLYVLLKDNYRSRPDIVDLLSVVFYKEQDVLVPHAELGEINISAVQFFACEGKETVHGVSYINEQEADVIVLQVKELISMWPSEWGHVDLEKIAVITTSTGQVHLIRQQLRQNKLGKVVVDRVHNTQGKEFRVVLLSTVRSRDLAHNREEVLSRNLISRDHHLGFLSDKLMLNTAMSRTQSVLIVVGDPIALCAIGNCKSVWRIFLQQCAMLQTIRPARYTIDLIKQQVAKMDSASFQTVSAVPVSISSDHRSSGTFEVSKGSKTKNSLPPGPATHPFFDQFKKNAISMAPALPISSTSVPSASALPTFSESVSSQIVPGSSGDQNIPKTASNMPTKLPSSLMNSVFTANFDLNHSAVPARPIGSSLILPSNCLPTAVAKPSVSSIFDQKLSINTMQVVQGCLGIRDSLDGPCSLAFTLELKESNYCLTLYVADITCEYRLNDEIDQSFAQKDGQLDTLLSYPSFPSPSFPVMESLPNALFNCKTASIAYAFPFVISSNDDMKMKRSLPHLEYIRCGKVLNSSDIEEMLEETLDTENEVQMWLSDLSKLAILWGEKRLGMAGLDIVLQPESNASMILEEVRLQIGSAVADFMKEKKQMIPLWQQPPPVDSPMEVWRKRWTAQASHSLVLRKAFLHPGKICQCKKECSCVPPWNGKVLLSKLVWERMELAAEAGEIGTLKRLLADSTLHAGSAIAWFELNWILPRAHFSVQPGFLYLLNIQSVGIITDPVYSYMSLIAQRCLRAAILNMAAPYSREHLQEICRHQNDRLRTRHKLWKMVQYSGEVVPQACILSWDQAKFHLLLPGSSLAQIPVQFSCLRLATNPTIESGAITLSWCWPVYDIEMRLGGMQMPDVSPVIQLDPMRLQIPLDSAYWRKLLSMVPRKSRKLIEAFKAISQSIEPITPSSHRKSNIDLTSKMSRFTLTLKPSSLLHLETKQGTNEPLLFYLADNFAICLQHQMFPNECFVGQALKSCSARDAQFSQLESKAAILACRGMSVMLLNVQVKWYCLQEDQQHHAVFVLPLTTLQACGIELQRGCQTSPFTALDFWCIRLKLNHNTWVAHCASTVVAINSDSATVQLDLRSSSAPLPHELTTTMSHKAVIEWIPKTNDIRMEELAIKKGAAFS